MKEEGVDFNPSFKPSEFVQVKELSPLPLSKVSRDRLPSTNPQTIPDLVYEPQEEGAWHNSAYWYDFPRKRVGKRDRRRVVDLFSGAGGMSLGFEECGFTTAMAVEINPEAVETYTTNHPNSPVYPGNVNDWIARYRRSDDALREFGRIEHIHASSPCQGFSVVNIGGGKNDERNNALAMSVVDAAELFRPITITFENVMGMWNRKKQHHLKNLLARLMELGYQVRCTSLNACDFGDPQRRSRIVIFAALNVAVLPDVPVRTHGKSRPFTTVGDALGGIGSHKSYTNMYGKATRERALGAVGVERLKKDELGATIIASVPHVHFEEDRFITVREAAALQSFLTCSKFCGTVDQQYKQIENAVPLRLARAIALSVKQVLEYVYEDEREGDSHTKLYS